MDGPAIVPAACDPTKSLKDSPSCIDDSVGVFVSSMGDDGAAGNKAAPVKSISKGLELAASRHLPRVYVCEGVYDANVEVKIPVKIFGGLTCAWATSGGAAKIAPPKGIALRTTKVSGAVAIEDVDVIGFADTNVPGDSAIAVFVSESADVTFRRTNLTAGAARQGAKGASRSNYTAATAKDGGNASGATAGIGPVCT